MTKTEYYYYLLIILSYITGLRMTQQRHNINLFFIITEYA